MFDHKKHIFKIGTNRIFDFRQDGKFCLDLSNVISGGNWLFRWDCFFLCVFVCFLFFLFCFFQVGLCNPLQTMLVADVQKERIKDDFFKNFATNSQEKNSLEYNLYISRPMLFYIMTNLFIYK